MAVPDFQTLMLPVLQAMAAREPVTSAELRRKVATAAGLSPDDLAEMLPSGRQGTFANRVAWANVFLQRALLIEPVERGVYRITTRGREVLAKSPTLIDRMFLRRFPEYRAWREASRRGGDAGSDDDPVKGSTGTPLETIEQAVEAMNAELRTALLARVRSLSPDAFERLILALLLAMGYGSGQAALARQTRRTNDDGIDGVISEDPLGLDRVFIQAKRYAPDNQIGRPAVQAFVGSLAGHGVAKGVFVTTSAFTSGAVEYAQRVQSRIILIDGEELARHMISYNVGVRVDQTFAVKGIDENAFED